VWSFGLGVLLLEEVKWTAVMDLETDKVDKFAIMINEHM
jgi:hypothetical protein